MANPTITRFYGSTVAIVTPMKKNGEVCFDTLTTLIEWHIGQGTDGLVMVGTTGESPTVNVDEHKKIIAHAVKVADGRLPIIAGTGANSTDEAIHLTQFAEACGANAALSVVPYYNKPTQEGLYQHFRAVAGAVKIPIILYNVPGRTVADLQNDTVLRLAEINNIVGIKDATGDLQRGGDLLRRLALAGKHDFVVLSGDDATALPLMLLGAKGVISVTANVAPRLMHEMCSAALANQWEVAKKAHFSLLPLHQKLFVEANPIPVKWAVAKMGLLENTLRLPLTPMDKSFEGVVADAMRAAGIQV